MEKNHKKYGFNQQELYEDALKACDNYNAIAIEVLTPSLASCSLAQCADFVEAVSKIDYLQGLHCQPEDIQAKRTYEADG